MWLSKKQALEQIIGFDARRGMIELCPFAVQRPGPAWKAGYFVGVAWPKRGEVKHSAEGYWPGIYARLDGPDRASWHFTIGYDRIEQHYPVSMNCWHAGDVGDDGGVRANIDLVGVEHLGIAGDPLTEYQLTMTKRLTEWLRDTRGKTSLARYPLQPPGAWVLAEHNQVSDEPTACPSGRIPWPLIMAPEEDDMAISLALTFVPAPVNGVRLYALGQSVPCWITSQQVAADLERAFGKPKELAWGTLVALGAK